ncbi:MAG: DUF6132 family protein [Ignavibacteria bacterium]|nr:DUF6132 family protein [Ignavibacteria bacterium]
MIRRILELRKRKYFKMFLFALIGFIGGYGYYYFIGCYNGSCPITSKWWTSSLYGMLIGAIAGFPSAPKKSEEKRND